MTRQADGRLPRPPWGSAPPPSPPRQHRQLPLHHPPSRCRRRRRRSYQPPPPLPGRLGRRGSPASLGPFPGPQSLPRRKAGSGGKRLWTSTRCRGRASPRRSWRSTSGSPSASWGASRRSAGRSAVSGSGDGAALAPSLGLLGSSRRPGSTAGGARILAGKNWLRRPRLWGFQVPLERAGLMSFLELNVLL